MRRRETQKSTPSNSTRLYAPCSLDTVRGVLTCMPNLREVELRYLLFITESETPSYFTSRPFTIQYLIVENFSAVNKDVSTFFDLICLFSDIENFGFTCGPWEVIPGAVSYRCRYRASTTSACTTF